MGAYWADLEWVAAQDARRFVYTPTPSISSTSLFSFPFVYCVQVCEASITLFFCPVFFSPIFLVLRSENFIVHDCMIIFSSRFSFRKTLIEVVTNQMNMHFFLSWPKIQCTKSYTYSLIVILIHQSSAITFISYQICLIEESTFRL